MRMPSSAPPPTARLWLFAEHLRLRAQPSSRRAQNTAASSSSAATISRFTGPSVPARPMVSAGPASAPALPPAAMKPNRRLPCSELQTSAMNDQNTETANRSNTLIQTKNTRATVSRSTSSASSTQKSARLRTKKW